MYGNSLLDNADVLQQLFTNPSYVKIGPACDLLKNMRTAITTLSRDSHGAFIQNDVFIASKKALLHGALPATNTYTGSYTPLTLPTTYPV